MRNQPLYKRGKNSPKKRTTFDIVTKIVVWLMLFAMVGTILISTGIAVYGQFFSK
ncbi:DUF4044 domain-containing protein [Atopobacter phocae]|uniref:DUF4044 domain-containing protein n=1 Tax=Atopobacter phocae TaxID=136492 RepID=UPI0004B24DD7|nr:DUF4044 domain-containing protein [Atopobacter phocae]